jgi:MFS family permease
VTAERATRRARTRGLERRWWALVAICCATFMLLVDVAIVQVALPRIQRDLDASFTNLQWVIDAYALTLSALILTCGTLADRIGRKRVFSGGVAIFTLASLLCGLSSSATLLIFARALQGVGGAAMFATSLALIAQEFEGAERGNAIAAWGSTVGGAVAIGPLIGGALTDALGSLGVVPVERSGMASGISNTFRIGGLATGVAALGAVFQHRVSTSLEASLGKLPAAVTKAVASSGTHAAAALEHSHPGIVEAARGAFAAGLNRILLIGAGLVLVGAVAALALALVRARDFRHPRVSEPPATSTAETARA